MALPSTSSDAPGSVGTPGLRLVVASSVIGTTVEWYDFFLYGTAAGIVFDKLYFPSDDPLAGTLLAFATFALGFVARPVGGLVFGHIGDRIGRKKTLVATMLIMGLATCTIGLVPTYATIGVSAPIILVLLRLAQGVAIGGEWGGAVLMSVEYASHGRRGLYGSIPQLGLALGLMLGTGVFAALNTITSEQAFLAWGWRLAFLLSAVLVVCGIIVRLEVADTPAFRQMQEHEHQASVPVASLARSRTSRRNVLLGMGSRLSEGIAFNAWVVFSISYGTETLGLREQPLLVAVMVAAAVMLVFIPFFGRLSDRIGRRRMFVCGALITGSLAYPALAAMELRNPFVLTLGLVAVLGIAYPAMYGPQAAFYAEMFPTHVRCTGISFVYQFSGIFASGLTPLALSYFVGIASGGYDLVLLYLLSTTVVSVACAVAVRATDLQEDRDASSNRADAVTS